MLYDFPYINDNHILFFFCFILSLIKIYFLFHNINTIITSHYYLIKIILTYYKDFTFLNICEKSIGQTFKNRGSTFIEFMISAKITRSKFW